MTSDEMLARAQSKLKHSFIDLKSIADDPGFFNSTAMEVVDAIKQVENAFAFVIQVKGVIRDSRQ